MVCLAGLAIVWPLAAVTLPDPLSIAGVYDGGDFDDLVASCDIGPPSLPALLQPFGLRFTELGTEPPLVELEVALLTDSPRAPPIR